MANERHYVIKTLPTRQRLLFVVIFVTVCTTGCRSSRDMGGMVTAILHVEKSRFRIGEALVVTMTISNDGKPAVELVDALHPVDYWTVIDETSASVQTVMASKREYDGLHNERALPPRAAKSVCSYPLLEIYVATKGMLKMARRHSSTRVAIRPGESWRASVDIAPLLPGAGEYIVVGSLNQPSDAFENPVRALTTNPLTLRVEEHDLPNR